MNNKVVIGFLIAAVLAVGVFIYKDVTDGNTSSTQSESVTTSETNSQTQQVKIEDIVVGEGAEAKSGDTVVVHYTGTLEDPSAPGSGQAGTEFDSSIGGEPFTTQIGVGAVIQGWDQGIPGMKVGGKRKLIIPSELGYGAAGAGDKIPPNSVLIFEVDLLEVK